MLMMLIKSSQLDLGAAAEHGPALRAFLGCVAVEPDPPSYTKL